MADLSGPELFLAGAYAAIGVGAAVRPGMAPARLGGAVLAGRLRPWPTGAFLALEAALALAASRARGG